MLSVPVTFASMRNGDIDVFLGNWMPAQAADAARRTSTTATVEVVRANLVGAKYTLAVPDYLHDAGLKDFADIAAIPKRAGRHRFTASSPATTATRTSSSMIEKNEFGLGGFKLVESSEQGMLAAGRARRSRASRPIVFLGWAPHPMNTHFNVRYLTGGDDSVRPELRRRHGQHRSCATATSSECPNVGRLLQNLEFDVDIENELMDRILDATRCARPISRASGWRSDPPQLDALARRRARRSTGSPALAAVDAGPVRPARRRRRSRTG